MGFDEAGNDVGDDKGIVGGKLGDIDCVAGYAVVVGLVNEFVDEVAFFLKHEGGGCELVDDVYA